MRIPFRALLMVAVLVCSAGCGKSAPPQDRRNTAFNEVRAASEQWWKAAHDRDAEKFMTFYAMEAQLLPPDSRIVRGRDDIRSAILTMMSTPHFKVDGSHDRLEASHSGDFAWESGRFDLTMQTSQGTVETWQGKYVLIWQKRAGGQWRIVSNIFNSDRPASEMTAGLN